MSQQTNVIDNLIESITIGKRPFFLQPLNTLCWVCTAVAKPCWWIQLLAVCSWVAYFTKVHRSQEELLGRGVRWLPGAACFAVESDPNGHDRWSSNPESADILFLSCVLVVAAAWPKPHPFLCACNVWSQYHNCHLAFFDPLLLLSLQIVHLHIHTFVILTNKTISRGKSE